MLRAFIRCNEGHYFQGSHCPFDGWSSAESIEFAAALGKLDTEGTEPSLSAFRKLGLREEVLRLVISVELGSPDAAFEAVEPHSYVVNRKNLKPGTYGIKTSQHPI